MASPYTYFPATYQNTFNPYQQNYQPQQAQSQQIQNGGLVSVRSRAEAMNYPVAPGNSVTFKDETAPFVYTKTMGFSQLDRPVFETYRLIKEEQPKQEEIASKQGDGVDLSIYATKAEIEPILTRIEALEADKVAKKAKKKEGNDDE